MLIVVSGVQSINVREISDQVFLGINTFQIDGYSVNFRERTFKITDSTGTTVYATDVFGEPVTTLLETEEGRNVFNKATELMSSLFSERNNLHFSTKFAEDFFVGNGGKSTSDVDEQWPDLHNSVITAYTNKSYEHMVISGGFSKHTINRFRSSLGNSEVKVINIIRNPSSSYIYNLRSPGFYKTVDHTIEQQNRDKKLRISILNSYLLSNEQDIETKKFEDLIDRESVRLFGKNVPLGRNFRKYNKYSTQAELLMIQPFSEALGQDLDTFNNFMKDFKTSALQTTEEQDQTILDTASNILPNNMFSALGYEPLTYNQIIS